MEDLLHLERSGVALERQLENLRNKVKKIEQLLDLKPCCQDCIACIRTLPDNRGKWICKERSKWPWGTLNLDEKDLGKINNCPYFEQKTN